MRYVLAIAALVISGVLLLLGIGQRTFLAGPAEIRFPLDSAADAPYAVLSGEQIMAVPGQANVIVTGVGAFIATGEQRDIDAWAEAFDHAVLALDEDGKRLAGDVVPADAAESPVEPLDPRGSDLWTAEKEGDGSTDALRVPVKLDEDQAVLIATDGTAPIPADIALVWVQDRQTPWAGPLLVAGGVFALVGGVLYLLAIDRDRRGLGPQRGRRGPLLGIRNAFGRKRVVHADPALPGDADGEAVRGVSVSRIAAIPVLGIALTLGLTGCSPGYWPQPGEAEPEATPTESAVVAPVPVTDAQIDRIMERVAAVADEADAALDAELLAERFSGDALTQRTANYKIHEEIPDYGVNPPHITSEALDYQLVQSTEGWPRTLFLTVASTRGGADADEEGADESSSPSLALVLTQESPHQNYLVSRVIALRGGISMPQAAPAEEGTALLDDDLQSLVLPPGEVGAAFASVLQEGDASTQFDLFDVGDDKLLENYGKARAAQAQAQAEDDGKPLKHSVTARQGDEPTMALSTGVGGALVATTVYEEQTVDSDGGRYKPQATGAITALSGLEGQQDRIVQVLSHQLLFFVPGKEAGGKIQLLGETSELVEVRN